MIEIIPNWHPIFVHFTVALFSVSVGFYTLAYVLTKLHLSPKLSQEIEITARWCLWVVGILVIGTVLAGLQAYNTVKHDAPSHLAMTDHRNWALVTAAGILFGSLLSAWRTYKKKGITFLFIVFIFVVQGLLLATAWRGAELVFRYGLGVMSLPQSEGKGHHHPSDSSTQANPSETPSNHSHDSDDHHHE